MIDKFWDDCALAFYKLDKIEQILNDSITDVNFEDNAAYYLNKIWEVIRCNQI